MSVYPDEELFCEECNARFRNECVHAAEELGEPEVMETWFGADGHKYVGDPKRSSAAYHADDCPCYTSEDWY